MSNPTDDSEHARASSMAGQLRVLLSRLRARTRGVRPGGLSAPHLVALSHLERNGPATVTALAKVEGMRPQSMGAHVLVLEQAGLVTRSADPNDGRQVILSLTPASHELIKNYRAAREDWLAQEIQTKLSAAEQDELAKSLELIERLIRPA